MKSDQTISMGALCRGAIEFIEREVPEDKMCILGLSGGVDSAVVAHLLYMAVGPERMKILLLPCGEKDEDAVDRAVEVIEELKLDCDIVDISPLVDAFFDAYKEDEEIDRIRIGNFGSRIRMAILYDYAKKYNGYVIGTTNKSEWMTGYFTKYGDGGVDIEPILDVYKTDVFKMGEFLGLPKSILNAKPTAGFYAGQTDEDELGMSYEKLDRILDNPVKEYSDVTQEDRELVRKLIDDSEHKRPREE